MIIETIFSSLDESGQPHFAPMGITWGEDLVVVRPFRSSSTCRNLLAAGCGVASLTDDVLAYVQCGLYHLPLPHFPAEDLPGVVFQGACSWLELKVIEDRGGSERAEVDCRVVNRGWQREFLGFCRARGMVIEAAILATRLHLVDRAVIAGRLAECEQVVLKTGDEPERKAMQYVRGYVEEWCIENPH